MTDGQQSPNIHTRCSNLIEHQMLRSHNEKVNTQKGVDENYSYMEPRAWRNPVKGEIKGKANQERT